MPEPRRPLKVFLCHASADKPKVRELYRTLRRRGMQPWLDAEDLVPGQNWEIEIPKALYSSDAIIICLSPHSVNKEGYVQKEIKFALDKALEMPEGRIFIIPARLEECELPFSLRQYQAVNLYEKEGYTRLMKALKLRASQLERATVELPREREIVPDIKKIVEEKEPVGPTQEKPETTPFESSHEPSLKGMNVGSNVITVFTKPEEKGIETPEAKVEKPEPKKTISPRKSNTAITVALISLAIIAGLLGLPLIEKWFSPVPVPTETSTATTSLLPPAASLTSKPVLTSTNTTEPSLTPTATTIPTITFTPTSTLSPTPLPTQIIDAQDVQMVLVPAGEFTMGGNADDALAKCQKISSLCLRSMFENEEPPHNVYLTAYYIDKYEVTNKFYKICVEIGVCSPPTRTTLWDRNPYYGNSEFNNYPVNYIDWNMAKTYCEWRGARLPTEAEWEKAARGTDGRTYPWGEVFSCYNANYGSCYHNTTEVGKYLSGKSPYGLYDMSGNVSEWTADWYSETYYQITSSINPLGPDSGERRVIRGGAYITYSGAVANGRTTSRGNYPPARGWDFIGFRCAKDATP